MLPSPDTIERNLQQLKPVWLRGAISRLATAVPQSVLFSEDLPRRGEKIFAPLALIATSKNLQKGDTLRSCVKGLTYGGADTGDWEVCIERHNLEAGEIAGGPISQEETWLRSLPQDELKSCLGRLADFTPRTIFVHPDFLADLPPTTINDGKVLTDISQAVAFLCNWLAGSTPEDETWTTYFFSVAHGLSDASSWKIEVICRRAGQPKP